jgi:feruloyl esterase
VALAEKLDNVTLNATDPKLQPFVATAESSSCITAGTIKLIDPQNSANYYTSVTAEMGGRRQGEKSIRLFMAPGMGHCAGGPGPNTFDAVGALEQWVEQGAAHYKGTRSAAAAANFVCRVE